ncbi:MAG: glycosyltransferase family 9 protein [Planctomycetota bacterium]
MKAPRAKGRVLVFHTGAIGDLVLAAGAFRALRERFRQERIEAVGYPERLSLLCACGLVDAAHSIDGHGLFHLFTASGELPRCALEFLRGAATVVSWISDIEGNFERNLRRVGVGTVVIGEAFPQAGSRVHVADHYLATLRPLRLAGRGARRLSLAPELLERARAQLAPLRASARVVGMLPGSGSARKTWPRGRFLELAERISAARDVALAVFLGPAERDRGDEESWRTRERNGLALFVERPLVEVAALIREVDLFIGCDSGLSHLAAALGTPLLALFGPTDPAIWGPRGKNVRILQGRDGDVSGIAVEEVLRAAAQLLGERRRCRRELDSNRSGG